MMSLKLLLGCNSNSAPRWKNSPQMGSQSCADHHAHIHTHLYTRGHVSIVRLPTCMFLMNPQETHMGMERTYTAATLPSVPLVSFHRISSGKKITKQHIDVVFFPRCLFPSRPVPTARRGWSWTWSSPPMAFPS